MSNDIISSDESKYYYFWILPAYIIKYTIIIWLPENIPYLRIKSKIWICNNILVESEKVLSATNNILKIKHVLFAA